MANKSLKVGIVAPCSTVPVMEFDEGAQYLRRQGFDLQVHDQVAQHHFTFAGTDESRAGALYAQAKDSSIDVVWSARGAYGAQRLLPILDRLTAEQGKPAKKLLVGYSDVMVLHEYVRDVWGWSTLHAPMPAATNFARLKSEQWDAILKLARGEMVEYPAGKGSVQWMTGKPNSAIVAPLVGGNLCLWTCLVGTKHPPTKGEGRILFFEDVGEPFYRIDRMMTQLVQSGALDGAAAIVLGDFTNCNDEDNKCLKPVEGEARRKAFENPDSAEKIPLRKVFDQKEGFEEMFTSVAKKLGVPLAQGLPVGHGPNFYPLPLGAKCELSVEGKLKLLEWDWLKRENWV
jgi:muramoyltetrapeptide carboxypeptidase